MPVYKDEKRKTWFVKTRYTDWQGKRRETTKRGFATRREAKEWEDNFRLESKNSPSMTLESLASIYMEDARKRLKAQSFYAVERTVKKHILPDLGKMSLQDITANTIRKWQNALYGRRSRSGACLSQSTMHNINVHLSSILNYAVKFYGLSDNPLRKAGKSGRMETREDFWEREEFERFISAVDSDEYKMYFTVLYTSGMRSGEFLALEPSDIDLANHRIKITKSLEQKTGRITSTKTSTSNREISMPENVMESIASYLKSFYEPPPRVFYATSHNKLSYRFKMYIEKSGVPRITLHGLRHSHASFLIHSGVPITAISKRLGHRNPQITLQVYSHMYESSDKDIAALLESKLCGQNVVTDKNIEP